MMTRPNDRWNSIVRLGIAAVSVFVILALSGSPANAQSRLSLPAEFVHYLSPPGPADHFLKPAAIRTDSRHHEVMIADPGNNRVLIFDDSGCWRFTIDMADDVSFPADVGVDSEGYIYVLGATNEGKRIYRFDFDGLYLGELPTPQQIDGKQLELRSIAVDDADIIHASDHAGARIVSFDRQGNLRGQFPLVANSDPEDEDAWQNAAVGAITAHEGFLYVPFSVGGTVRVYRPDGELVRLIGHKGATVGQLNFPLAVAFTSDGLTLVLDQARFNVSCYDEHGGFRGEFGGMGTSPGWFYFPSLLAVDAAGHVLVGQLFGNRIQACRIPEPIRAAAPGMTTPDKDHG